MNKSSLSFHVSQCETLFQGYFRMSKLHVVHDRFEGGQLGPITREVLERGHAAAVLPYDPVRDRVLLLEQFRAGPAMAGDPQPWLIEVPAGIIESNESPEDVALREAEEEAGCAITELAHIHNCYLSPGCVSEHCSLYIGNAELAGVGGVFGLEVENENIRTHIITANEAFYWLAQGRVRNSIAIIALQWLQLHREELRRHWSKDNNNEQNTPYSHYR